MVKIIGMDIIEDDSFERDQMIMLAPGMQWVKRVPEETITSSVEKKDESSWTIKVTFPVPDLHLFKVGNIGESNG